MVYQPESMASLLPKCLERHGWSFRSHDVAMNPSATSKKIHHQVVKCTFSYGIGGDPANKVFLFSPKVIGPFTFKMTI